MIFKDVSRIKVDRPRNSYHSPIPSLQLMSKVSTFDGDLKEEFREEQAFTDSNIEPNSCRNKTLQSKDMSQTLQHDNKYIFNANSTSDSSSSARPFTSSTSGIIGGVRSYNPWNTTANSQMNGEANKKLVSSVKRVTAATSISPITGIESVVYNPVKLVESSQLNKYGTRDFQDEENPLIVRLREDIIKHAGGLGIVNLGRKFRIIDDDNSKTISFSEFVKAMNETSLRLSDLEVKVIFQLFDRHHTGEISYDDFLLMLAGPMNSRRINLIQQAYDVLDVDGNGIVDLDDFSQAYNVSYHPDFISKKKTKEQILRELLDVFDVGGENDGKITRKEFTNYYAGISASIDNDDYFELMIRNAWHMSGGEGAAANTANRRVLVTQPDGSERVLELKRDLRLNFKDEKEIQNQLQLNSSLNKLTDGAKFSTFGSVSNISKANTGVLPQLSVKSNNNVNFHANPCLRINPTLRDIAAMQNNKCAESSISEISAQAPSLLNHLTGKTVSSTVQTPEKLGIKLYQHSVPEIEAVKSDEQIAIEGPLATFVANKLLSAGTNNKNICKCCSGLSGVGIIVKPQSRAVTNRTPDPASLIDPGTQLIVNKLKNSIDTYGAKGYTHLQRLFWSYDSDQNGELDFSEFKSALKDPELGIALVDRDIQKLFNFFDKDQSETISMTEFFNAVREPLAGERLNHVLTAFKKLDKKKTNQISASDIATLYDPTSHPEVVAKRSSPDQMYKEFLETFDMGKDISGIATKADFINYYTNLSSFIKNDDYFYLLLRSTWSLFPQDLVQSLTTNGDVQIDGGRSSGNVHLGSVNRLRAKTAAASSDTSKLSDSAETIDSTVKDSILTIKKLAVQKYNNSQFAAAKQLFELIRDKFTEHNISDSHPDYIINERSILLCMKRI